MSLTYSTAAKNAALDAAVDLVDIGTTNPNGRLVVMTSTDTTIAELDLADPAYGAAAAGTKTLLSVPISDTAVIDGVAALFKVVDKDENEIFRGTISIVGGGGDAEIDDPNVVTGDTIRLNSHTITHA